MRAMTVPYFRDFPSVGSRAPWRERMDANVSLQVGGRTLGISEGTL